jgi:hypothetical protein
MNKKTYNQIDKRLVKVCNALKDLMTNHHPDDIFEVIMTNSPPEDVTLIALFCVNVQTRFVQKTVDLVIQTDTECNSQAEICASCDIREECPDRKDATWIQ